MVSQTLVDCGLQDVGYMGYRFTWSNKRKSPHTIQERLDYALVNDSWRGFWPVMRVNHLTRFKSDHNPILVRCCTHHRHTMRWTHMFRFDEVWLQNGDECGEVVAETWSASADGLQQKLAEVGVALGSWGMEKFGNIPKKVEETRVILQDLQRRDHTSQVGDQIQRAEAELDSLLEQEEIMWSQRSRATWLKHRDRNTRVFHQKSSQRRRRNLIEEIKDDDGRTWVDDVDIGRVLTGYFKDLFSTSGPT